MRKAGILAAMMAATSVTAVAQTEVSKANTWHILFDDDKAAGLRTCVMAGGAVALMVEISQWHRRVESLSAKVYALGGRQPGSTLYVRVDDRFSSTEKVSFRGHEAMGIIESLMKGSRLYVSFTAVGGRSARYEAPVGEFTNAFLDCSSRLRLP